MYTLPLCSLRHMTHSPSAMILSVVRPLRPQIALAVIVFHDRITWLKLVGLVVAIQGSILYKVARGKPNPRTGEGRAGKDER